MFYQNFINIKNDFLLDDTVYANSLDVFKKLRPSDTLTTGVYSRKTKLPFELSEKILIECVNQGLLNIIVLVPCSEDDEHPPVTFNSLREFSKASLSMDKKCSYCDSDLAFNEARVAFRRSDKIVPVEVQKS